MIPISFEVNGKRFRVIEVPEMVADDNGRRARSLIDLTEGVVWLDRAVPRSLVPRVMGSVASAIVELALAEAKPQRTRRKRKPA